MITFPDTTLREIEEVCDVGALLEPLISNGWSVQDFKDFLGSSKLKAIKDGGILGFFLYEPMSDSVEVHAFVLPQHRNRSMSVLRAFKAYLMGDLRFRKIVTTVTGDYGHLVRFLKMIGFQPTNVEEEVVIKTSGVFNVTYLECVKE